MTPHGHSQAGPRSQSGDACSHVSFGDRRQHSERRADGPDGEIGQGGQPGGPGQLCSRRDGLPAARGAPATPLPTGLVPRSKTRWSRCARALSALSLLASSLFLLLWTNPTLAAKAPTIGDTLGKESVSNRPLLLMVALAGLALVPFVLIMVTSFVKVAVVLSVVRQAIGTQQIPPTQVLTGLATILTVYIMMPVGLDIYHDVRERMISPEYRHFSMDTFKASQITTLISVGQEPLRVFLTRHAHLKDRDMFFKLAWKMRKPRDRAMLTDHDWSVIVPSFVISELKEAFQIGFILFIPFLVVDMVVANILMALGMQMLSPTTISLPFKILLFVMVDGWYLITRGLVLGYQ